MSLPPGKWTPCKEGATMSVVRIAEAWAAAGRPFTVAELDRMPDDGRGYELLDGTLVVSPRPTTIHQVVAGRLYGVLSGACPEDLCVVPEPGVELGPQTEFDPDLVVVRMDQFGGAKFTEPPLLVVEIRSPQHRARRPEWEEGCVRAVRSPVVLDPEPGPARAGADRLRDARRRLRSGGQSLWVLRRRASLHPEHRPSRPDSRIAPLTGGRVQPGQVDPLIADAIALFTHHRP